MVIYKTRSSGVFKNTITAVGGSRAERRTWVTLCINVCTARSLVRTGPSLVPSAAPEAAVIKGSGYPSQASSADVFMSLDFQIGMSNSTHSLVRLELEWSWVFPSLPFPINPWSRGFTTTWTSQSVWPGAMRVLHDLQGHLESSGSPWPSKIFKCSILQSLGIPDYLTICDWTKAFF